MDRTFDHRISAIVTFLAAFMLYHWHTDSLLKYALKWTGLAILSFVIIGCVTNLVLSSPAVGLLCERLRFARGFSSVPVIQHQPQYPVQRDPDIDDIFPEA